MTDESTNGRCGRIDMSPQGRRLVCVAPAVDCGPEYATGHYFVFEDEQ